MKPVSREQEINEFSRMKRDIFSLFCVVFSEAYGESEEASLTAILSIWSSVAQTQATALAVSVLIMSLFIL